MILITGGAYEGKKEYAVRRFGFSDSEITDGKNASETEILNAVCIADYHEFVRRTENPEKFTERFVRENSSAVVIMNETGCGIVPLDKGERIWREQTGRCGCIIAAASDEVIRVFCGIPAVVKSVKEI